MVEDSKVYRSFFVLGWCFACIGGGLWLWPSRMPIASHSEVLLGGFLLSFSAGFLLTAIPRITQGPAPRGKGVWLLFVLLLLGVLFSVFGDSGMAYSTYLGASFVLASLLISSFLKRTYDPPPFFIFVAVGLLSGIMGQILILSSSQTRFLQFGKDLFFQMMMLSFVVGIGSRIIPFLLGWKEIVFDARDQVPATNIRSFLSRLHWHLSLSAVALFLSFILEHFWSVSFGQYFRAVLISPVVFGPWKLYRLPKIKTFFSLFLWLSCWALVVGLWAYALSDAFKIHWLHLVFIGSFSLMTLMVAFHVVLEHEEWGFAKKASPVLGLAGGLLLLSLFLRLGVSFDPARYLFWMKISSVLWCLAFAAWLIALGGAHNRFNK